MTPRKDRRIPVVPAVLWALGAALCAGAALYLGLPPAVAVAVAILVAAVAVACLGLAVDPSRVRHAEPRDPRPGMRTDVAWVAWGLSSRGSGLGPTGVERVRTFARRRLLAHGLDVDDAADRPELERMFGGATWRMLTATGARGATLGAVEHCLDVLDELDERGRTA